MRNDFKYFSIISTVLTLAIGYFWQPFLWVFIVLIPLILLGAAGLENPSQIRRSMINRRVIVSDSKRYDELYPYLKQGCLLNENTIPTSWKPYMNEANAYTFAKTFEDVEVG